MDLLQPAFLGMGGIKGGNPQLLQYATTDDIFVAAVAILPTARTGGIQRQVQVRLEAQPVVLLMGFVQSRFELMQRQSLEQPALADDAAQQAARIDDHHVADAVAGHFLEGGGDAGGADDGMQWRAHHLAELDGLRIGMGGKQPRNVAFGTDTCRPAVLGDNQIIGSRTEHRGNALGECGARWQARHVAIHDAFQRPQMAEDHAAKMDAEIAFADHADHLAFGSDNQQVPDVVLFNEMAGAEQIEIGGCRDQRLRHDVADGGFRRQRDMDGAQDVGFGDDAQRGVRRTDEQAGNPFVGHQQAGLA